MKIQRKIFLIVIAFWGIVFLNNSSSYADYYEIDEEVSNFIKETYFDDYYDTCFILPIDSTYIKYEFCAYVYNHDSFVTTCGNSTGGGDMFALSLDLSTNKEFKYISFYMDKSSHNFEIGFLTGTYNYDGDYNTGYYLCHPVSSFFVSDLLFYCNSTVYSSNVVYTQSNCYFTDKSFITGVFGQNGDKINLYELNMTDLDDNRKKHQFNLCTYTNSDCYDELMNYYNNDYQYAIYLTDYERILTYQNYDDDNSFLYGSYVISGYIDYLITDKAFFYYSEYYSQVLSDSGNSFFNKDIEDYTKRFYFKLTYSEDSNDPHASIWTDNGNLYKINYLESFEDRYFIGSSQTIYYSKENSKGNFKDLTKDIYYLGYLNSTEGKTRDISKIPFYVYNFDYAGGSTELYVVNQSDYDYEEMIKSRYDNWSEHYDDWTIITDGSIGGGYVQGNDLTSSTFEKGTVTDNTSTESDESHIGEIRTPSGDTDVIDKKKEEEKEIIGGNAITNLIDTIKNKFGFSNNIVSNANEIKDFISNTQETHKYYLNINHKYLKGNVCVIDLSWYEPYKPTADAFICAFAYLAFIWHMFCKIPDLIHGASATTYVSDINSYLKGG